MEISTSLAILVIAGILSVWEISAIAFTRQKVKVPCRVPGKVVGITLFVAASILIIWARWGTGVMELAAMAAVVVAGGLNFAIKNGLSDYGLYNNGWSTAYKNINYYDIESREDNLTRVRLSGDRKDVSVLFTDEDLEAALMLLGQNEVVDMDTYRIMKEKQKEEMAQQSRGTKKKRR